MRTGIMGGAILGVVFRKFFITIRVQSSSCCCDMCGSIEVDVWRARIGLFAARIASRLPKRWRKIKKQVASMLFTHGVFAGGGACSLGCVSNFGRKRETRLLAVLMSLLLATSVMNVSLLLRCGDIETNPGPGRYPGMVSRIPSCCMDKSDYPSLLCWS